MAAVGAANTETTVEAFSPLRGLFGGIIGSLRFVGSLAHKASFAQSAHGFIIVSSQGFDLNQF